MDETFGNFTHLADRPNMVVIKCWTNVPDVDCCASAMSCVKMKEITYQSP